MSPTASSFPPSGEGGIKRICEAMEKYLPDHGISFVGPDESDLIVDHAGALGGQAHVTLCAGLYWTGDGGNYSGWEYKANARVIDALRGAREIIVPSDWVAMNIARGMRVWPHVIPHGIDWDAWQNDEPNQKYILWAKNRVGDVCDPSPMYRLAQQVPELNFVTTFLPKNKPALSNITVTGLIPHNDMKKVIQRCGIYLSTTPETFGVATLEAMASGRPILGWRYKGNVGLVQHGINGYLAEPNNEDDLMAGLFYCLEHGDVLGANGRELAKGYTWQAACERMAEVFSMAQQDEDAAVSVIIPCHNYGDKVGRAIESALNQTQPVKEIIVLDDASDDNSAGVVEEYTRRDGRVRLIRCDYRNVARTRNHGIGESTGSYIVPLDADDTIAPTYVEKLLPVIRADRTLGVVYSKLRAVTSDGFESISAWPEEWDFDWQLRGGNQIPTCCMFRKKMWERLGGYNPRACPQGAGWEDADLWTRMGEFGWKAKLATEEPLFIYSWGSGQVSSKTPDEIQQSLEAEVEFYKVWYPWYSDHIHPFASYATSKLNSHPVYQYDEPLVSVIIPIGPNHESAALNAIQSIEAQSMRKWELIIVWDSKEPIPPLYKSGYPFTKWLETGGAKGAGFARNRGAELATAPLLLFVDADDWLYPQFLEKTLDAWNDKQEAVYTDYIGKSYINDKATLDELDRYGKLLYWDGSEAVTQHKGLTFDCAKAMREPDITHEFYVWCNITTLHPKSWWQELGGFDEAMPSWEDWDYWLRMVHAGYKFTCVHEPLMVYCFYTGNRRDLAHVQGANGRYMYEGLIQYLKDKYALSEQEGKIVGCPGCRKQASVSGVSNYYQPEGDRLEPTQKVWVRYQDRSMGDHWIDSPSQLAQTGNRTGYGYHATGDEFEAFYADAKLMPLNFQILGLIQKQVVAPQAVVNPAPLASPPLTVTSMMEGKQDTEANMKRLKEAMDRSQRDMLRQYLGKEPEPEYAPPPVKPKRKPGRPFKKKVEETEATNELV